ncbi:50S ribosomal protein L13 [Gordonia sp. (in: high G+C Gram-positive bacteria)]|uniref:50S ribosomal protein L13 n=1 Tax=Gordonia sp. (in: high G+C Gram-positive bacteria) TaxID=84139 RepID=UPI0016BB0E08|nr:50S ribosomal protein L13 [Gordonia sp. (in: high G+C Gram-positive bacteria)]NLG45931.1 50S ribosomal protein L13 [Gordonia sp. (in: high G+C Gram-positive bacteria)]
MPTYTPKAGDVTREWYIIDATDVVLGRLAVASANLLRGKGKPTFAPHIDGGDYVIIINAEKVAVSGNKLTDKRLYRHSGHPGGLKSQSIGELLATKPERVIESAVKGMLPKNKLGDAIGGKLKVYAGSDHPHAAQKPVNYEIKQVAQ